VKEEEEQKKKALDAKIRKHEDLIKDKISQKELERWLKLEHEAILQQDKIAEAKWL